MSYEYADPFNPWWAACAATEYILDAWRAILPWNALRERSSPPDASPNARVTSDAEIRPASPDSPSAQLERDASRQIAKSLDANDDAEKDNAWLNRFVREATCA